MRRLVILFSFVLALAVPAVAFAQAGTSFRAQLHELNGSGARGTAWVTVDGSTLIVRIQATGLEDGPHLRHIHGGALAVAGKSTVEVSKCPSPRADADGDGFVSVGEGVPDYGAVILNLNTFVTSGGTIDDVQTFTLDSALLPLDRRAIVLHGMTVNGTYDVSMPIVCGQLHNQG